MASPTIRLRLRLESALRRLLWVVWPSPPTSWSEVPARLRPTFSLVTRLSVAAVVAYLVAGAIYPGLSDLTAPLTALLVVQASTVGTLQMGLVRVAAVFTGVVVAVVLASFVGLTWWSLGAAIAAALLLGKVLRLGEQTVETPISAMLILGVSSPEVAAEVRVALTVVGTLVGIAFALIVPVSIPNLAASNAVRRVARAQAALLDEVALTLGQRPPDPEEVAAWFDWSTDIGHEIDNAERATVRAQESRRLNPRALTTAKVHPGLQAALRRLDNSRAAIGSLLMAISRATASGPVPEAREGELRRIFAVLLNDLADGLRSFGDLMSAEYGRHRDRADEARVRTQSIVDEARAVLTELMLLDVDPREHARLWLLHSSVLASVEQALVQLDLQHHQPRTEGWLIRRSGLGIPGLALAAGAPQGQEEPVRSDQQRHPGHAE